MFQWLRRKHCNHSYRKIGDQDLVLGKTSIHPSFVPGAQVVCIMCENTTEMRADEWALIEKKQEVLSNINRR